MWTVGMLSIGLILGFTFGRLWELRQQFRREHWQRIIDPDQCDPGHFFNASFKAFGKTVMSVVSECTADIEQSAQDSGMSIDDVRTLAMLGIYGACLLWQRMRILRVDPLQFSNEEPAVFRALQKSCSMCESREACIHDLLQDAIDPTGTNWREYCPNVATLNMVSALACCDY
ncbi:MAG: hypothetical protein P8173_17680 [Gammaproteobacteria bacterium]